jgi:hypothetical protein
MKTDDELINEIERRTVLALSWFTTDKKESEKQMRHVRDNVWELIKQRRAGFKHT